MVADRIVLTGMRFYGYHGVFPEETRLGQPFVVDMELLADLREAGLQDDLTRTVDYGKVYTAVKEIVEGRPFQLIEALAERLAGHVLDHFPVTEVVVRVHKPKAPIPGSFEGVMVEIRRGRAS
jgi:dihydroneopterin aldolase